MSDNARPFRIDVPDDVLDRISTKLKYAEVGYAPQDSSGWNYGTDARWLAGLLEYWRTKYDWRRAERALNRWPHFMASIDGQDIHFIHLRGAGGNKLPLILTHGWPGSFLEFDAALPLIVAKGHDVVVPCLPGYGFSPRPPNPIGQRDIALLWRKLMTQTLGYKRFGAQGGDWGSAITTLLGREHEDVVAGIHLNLFQARADTSEDDPQTTLWRNHMRAQQATALSYMMEQATKPQTIGLALADTPLGFAAWVCEKFHGWGDTHGDIESRFSKDQLLTNIMIYLVNDAVQSSIWLYRSLFTERRDDRRVTVPTALALFPAEFLPYPPRSAAERAFNVVRWTEMKSGGHFAAMEEPEAFAEDVTAFFADIA